MGRIALIRLFENRGCFLMAMPADNGLKSVLQRQKGLVRQSLSGIKVLKIMIKKPISPMNHEHLINGVSNTSENHREFGIYVLTYPGDYYLSVPLVRSLQYFNPEIPVMIIPGEGFDPHNHPFDVPVMDIPDGYWGQLGHADRKFWCFQGPFERFLYLDADIICIRSLEAFRQRVLAQKEPFIFVTQPIKHEVWSVATEDSSHPQHQECIGRAHAQLGNISLLKEFDPDFKPFARYTFNNGVFASSRLILSEANFQDLYEREQAFFKRRLGKTFNWRCFDLFFGDQGRLNYLVAKREIPVLDLEPDGHYIWGGCALAFDVDMVLENRAEFSFIHWAGCPRPSPSFFCNAPLLSSLTTIYRCLKPGYGALKEIPGYSVWRHFSGDLPLWEKLRWTLKDSKKIGRGILRQVLSTSRKVDQRV